MHKFKVQKTRDNTDITAATSSENQTYVSATLTSASPQGFFNMYTHNGNINKIKRSSGQPNTILENVPVPGGKLILAKNRDKPIGTFSDVVHESLGEGTYGKVKFTIGRDRSVQYATKVCAYRGQRQMTVEQWAQALVLEAAIMKTMYNTGFVYFYVSSVTAMVKAYLVMEMLGIKDLLTCINERNLTLENKLTISISLAKEIRRLHKLGYLHRDIKPEDVRIDEHYQAYLTDMGFAVKWLGGTLKVDSPGTLGYLHPLIANKSECSNKSDIFSFAVTMLTMFIDIDLDEMDFRGFALLRLSDVDPENNGNYLLSPAKWIKMHSQRNSWRQIPPEIQLLLVSLFKNSYDEILKIDSVIKRLENAKVKLCPPSALSTAPDQFSYAAMVNKNTVLEKTTTAQFKV